jgi:Chaperone of endosialidase
MSYSVTKTNGQVIPVADGTLDSNTSMVLIGKNYPAYGQYLNQNFIRLLENSANSTSPITPLTGQLWYDETNNVLKVWTGTAPFKPLASLAIAATSTPPTGYVQTGDLWYDSTKQQLFIYDVNANPSVWKLIGPPNTAASGQNGPVVTQVTNQNDSNTYNVIAFYLNNNIVAVLSDHPGTIVPQTTISGLQTIYPGFNLVGASQIPGIQFTGLANNASYINGLTSGQFMRSDQPTGTTGTLAVHNNLGLTVGLNSDYKASVAGTTVIVENQTPSGTMSLRVHNSSGNQIDSFDIDSNGNITHQRDTTFAGNLSMTGGSSYLVVSSTNNATNSTSGALQVSGGVGIAQDTYIGGKAFITGQVNVATSAINVGVNQVILWPNGSVNAQVISGQLTSSSQLGITQIGTQGVLQVTGLSTLSGGIVGVLNTNTQPYINTVGTLTYANVANKITSSYGSTGQVTLNADTTGGIEIGTRNRGASGNPYVYFHSSTYNNNYDAAVYASGGSNGSDGQGVLYLVAGNTNVSGHLYAGIDITSAGDVIAFSDQRLKQDITTIDSALDKVKQLRGVNYTRISTQKPSIGVIAQEVQQVIPEVVKETDGYLGVSYGNMVGLLIEAIKELSEQIEELKNGR